MQLSTLKIAWRNLGRSRKRTGLVMAAIALGQLTVVFVNCMMAGMYGDMLNTITGPLIGHVQLHHKEWREERAIDLYIDDLSDARKRIGQLDGVESISPRIYSAVLTASGERSDKPADAEPGMVVGIDVALETRDGGILEALPADQRPGNRSVVVGRALAAKLGIEPGQQIALIGQDADEFPASDLFEVKAVIRSSADIINRMGVVMSLADAGEFLAMPDQAHEIVIQGTDLNHAEALANEVKALPGMASAEVLPWREAAPELVQMIDMKGVFDLIFLAILFVAAAAGIANTAVMSTFERTREFGMLLAVGTRPGRIVRMVLIESVILGLAGVAIGSLIGAVLVKITGHTGIDYAALAGMSGEGADFGFKGLNFSYIIYPKFEWRHVIFGIAAVTATSVVASVWPAALAARLEPVEAMRS
ncbi:ABC transporter permease [Verrucomicrobiota bacterium]